MDSSKFSMIWLVLGLPLLGFLVQALAGSNVVKAMGEAKGKKVMGMFAVAPIVLSFLIGAMLTLQLSGAEPAARSFVVAGPSWIEILGLSIPFEWVVDPLSMTMVLIITGIGSLIHVYATAYMAEDKDFTRFFTYLNLFILAMLILVLGNNLALLFIGWEGVGLCSYLLIGFWYTDHANARAANKAFIVNRIGDWALTLGMFLIVCLMVREGQGGGSARLLSFDVVLAILPKALAANPGMATAIALLLFIGACGKSAQFPLYLWLPDAMAGPTPVSALIHAATMVTSGVVLLNRFNIVFALSPLASAIVVVIGAFTALFAALIAFGQMDIKKVLAYSTVSQLGFMFMGCGAGAYWTGMFHVTTHAFFKALLFLGAGAVIHAMAHNQDMRNYGNLRKYLPITFGTMVVAWLAISGFPFLSGFYSKEAILGSALASSQATVGGINFAQVAGWTGLFVALLTAAYMTRLMVLTFFTAEERWRSIEPSHDHDHHDLDKNHVPHEVPAAMWVPLGVLAVLSLVGGFLMERGGAFQKWLYPVEVATIGKVGEHPEGIPLVALSIAACALGIGFGFFAYLKGLPRNQGLDETRWSPWRRSQRDQFGYDEAMTNLTVEGGRDAATAFWTWVDQGVVDGALMGSGRLAKGLSTTMKVLQSGYVRFYAFMMLVGVIGILSFFMVQGGGK